MLASSPVTTFLVSNSVIMWRDALVPAIGRASNKNLLKKIEEHFPDFIVVSNADFKTQKTFSILIFSHFSTKTYVVAIH